ncbi:hypothetical protein GCM10027580_12910 [Corynebacterium faecale]
MKPPIVPLPCPFGSGECPNKGTSQGAMAPPSVGGPPCLINGHKKPGTTETLASRWHPVVPSP